MWPFLKRKKADEGQKAAPKPKFKFLSTGLSTDMFLFGNRTALKFWLPELVAQALEELSDLQGQTMSAMLREFLLTHAYGAYATATLKNTNPNCLKDSEIFFSIGGSGYEKKRSPTYWVPELGKNIAPIKVWIPSQLKDDLQILAGHVEIKLSQYVREIVISRLLGHGTLPMRPEMLTHVPTSDADRWCEDKTVKMKQVTRQEAKLYANTEPEVRWIEDQDND